MQKENDNKEKQRQIQLEKKREQSRSSRMDETEQERQVRLEKDRKRSRSGRMNETEEQHQIRLQQQRQRSQRNKIKKKLEKHSNENIDSTQGNPEMQLSTRPPWPEPIPRDLKETRLQQFLQQMSMPILAAVTCAVCNIRTPAKNSKKIPISKIPNVHLLKVSEELENLIKNSSECTGTFGNDNNINMIERIKSNTWL